MEPTFKDKDEDGEREKKDCEWNAFNENASGIDREKMNETQIEKSTAFKISPPSSPSPICDPLENKWKERLSSCYICKKSLLGINVFMYRDIAFCCDRCRGMKIFFDNRKEKERERERERMRIQQSTSTTGKQQLHIDEQHERDSSWS